MAEELSVKERMALITHELVEAFLCDYMEVSVAQVDAFDLEHIEEEKDPHYNSGDQRDCPYRLPHTYATAAERIMAGALGINWHEYDKNLSKL